MLNLYLIQFSLNLCLLASHWRSEVAIVSKSTLAHTATVVLTGGQVVIRLAPAKRLGGSHRTDERVFGRSLSLHPLFRSERGPLIWGIHVEDLVKATRVMLLILLSLSSGSNNVVATEVVHIAVLGVELGLELSNLSLHSCFCLTSLFLKI